MSDKPTFRALGVKEVSIEAIERRAVRGGYRRFRGADGFEAAIPLDVLRRTEHIARAAAPNEWTCRLVGRVGRDAEGLYVTVLGIILDPAAEVGPGHVETTHTSEAEVRRLSERLFPDAIQVGWCHGHIGYGARFSAADTATQRRWTHPYALGVVIDPFHEVAIGVYRGPEAELLTPVDEEEVGAPRPARSTRPGVCTASCAGRPGAPTRGRGARYPLLVVMGLTLLVGAALILRRSRTLEERFIVLSRREEELEHRVHLLEGRRCPAGVLERAIPGAAEGGSSPPTPPGAPGTAAPTRMGSRPRTPVTRRSPS